MSNKYYKYDGSIIPIGVAKVEPIIQQFLSIQDAMGKIQNDLDNVELPFLTLSPIVRNHGFSEATGQVITVSTNLPWEATASDSWITLSTSSGSGGGTIVYSVSENSGTTSRSGTITVTSGVDPVIFTVTQSGASSTLSVSPTSRSHGSDAVSGQTISISSNSSWTASASQSWVTLSSTSGSGGGSITYSLSANTGTSSRSASITFSGGGSTATFTISQAAATVQLEVTPSSQSHPHDSTSGTFTVTSNVSWTVSKMTSDTWYGVSGVTGSSFTFSLSENTGQTSRTGSFLVSGGGLSVVVNITQAPPPASIGTLEWVSDPANIGQPFAGGYLAGVIDNVQGSIDSADDYQSARIYALIVSPKSLESSSALRWDTRGTDAPSESGCRTRWNGLGATDTILAKNDDSTYPLFGHVRSVRASNPPPAITGGSDWYVPAMDELELIYRNLKPENQPNDPNNSTSTFPGSQNSGVNPSVFPSTSMYTSGSPAQTPVLDFRVGGSQALAGMYWTSTDGDWLGRAWSQHFDTNGSRGYQVATIKSTNIPIVRLVRRREF